MIAEQIRIKVGAAYSTVGGFSTRVGGEVYIVGATTYWRWINRKPYPNSWRDEAHSWRYTDIVGAIRAIVGGATSCTFDIGTQTKIEPYR